MKQKSLETRRVLTLAIAVAASACGSDDAKPNSDVTPSESLYAFVSQVETPDGGQTYVALTDGMPKQTLDLKQALEVPGYGDAFAFAGRVYLTRGETFEVVRARAEGNTLVEEAKVSFQGRGLAWMGDLFFASSEQAYLVNGEQYTIIEWNPSDMSIIREHDISAIRVDGWGSEFRGGFMRAEDGKLFVYWAYNNNREEFLNDFVLGVFDTKTKSFKVIEEPDCPSSAGFGGFFDELGDLYLIADSFGGFTYFGSSEPKDACVLRIKNGEDELDASYRFRPTEALGDGLAPWGFYYAGGGLAYTTAVNPAELPNYDSLFEFIFAPVHEGYSLNIRDLTAQKVANMPPDAVGFESVTLDGKALIPRSTAAADIFEVDDIQTTVYTLSDDGGTAERRFTMPGYLNNAIRLR